MVYPHSYRTEHSETQTTSSMYGEYYATKAETKIKIQEELKKLLQFIDTHRLRYIDEVAEAVKIPSIAGILSYRNDVINMIKFTETWLRRLGVQYECFNIGWHCLDGKKYRLPPAILGTLGNDKHKHTVCVYLHLDVQHPKKDEWNTKPFELSVINKRMFGAGVYKNKGALMAWFHAIESFQKSNVEIPINVKFIIESMHYKASEGLEEFLRTQRVHFLKDIDYVLVCDSNHLGKVPCLVYGSTGLCHFVVTVEQNESSKSDAKKVMEEIFKHVSDEEERILIKDIDESVAQITPDEEIVYNNIDFDVKELTLPPYRKKWDKVKLLMFFWRLPSILIQDLQECTCEDRKEKFPIAVKQGFILKMVPNQIPERIHPLVTRHIQEAAQNIGSDCTVRCDMLTAVRPWVEDIRSAHYEAARRATIQIYKENPNMIREDKPLHHVLLLDRVIGCNILVLPLDDYQTRGGESNESFSLRHYYECIKLIAAYMLQVSYIEKNDEKNQ